MKNGMKSRPHFSPSGRVHPGASFKTAALYAPAEKKNYGGLTSFTSTVVICVSLADPKNFWIYCLIIRSFLYHTDGVAHPSKAHSRKASFTEWVPRNDDGDERTHIKRLKKNAYCVRIEIGSLAF